MKRSSLSCLLSPIRVLGASLLAFTLVLTACNSGAPPSSSLFPASLTLTRIAGGFTRPVTITHAGDGSGRLFVVEQGGTIRFIRNGAVASIPFLNIASFVTPTGGEQRLLGLAFPPGYAARGSFYVNYTNRTGIGNTVFARFRLSPNPDLADPATREELLTIVQPFANHNGGQLAFGFDSLLYFATTACSSAGLTLPVAEYLHGSGDCAVIGGYV